MCCFSGTVQEVSRTKIFARGLANGRQFIAYQMRVSADAAVAMILPLPVPPKTQEGDVKFVDFSGYKDFFEDLDAGFPRIGVAAPAGDPSQNLKVYSVGNFNASFAPNLKDMDRLDPVYRLPRETWNALPAYKNHGFAVFQLKKGKQDVHPMVFDFPRKDPSQIFFPTVHIHDGVVHPEAEFDHTLYLQNSSKGPRTKLSSKWTESEDVPRSFLQVSKTKGVVEADEHIYRVKISGERKNVDIYL